MTSHKKIPRSSVCGKDVSFLRPFSAFRMIFPSEALLHLAGGGLLGIENTNRERKIFEKVGNDWKKLPLISRCFMQPAPGY